MSQAPPEWRARRARALAVSHHLRHLSRTFGRVPNCAPGRLGWAELERWIDRHDPPQECDRASLAAARTAGHWELGTAAYVAERCGVDRSQGYRWRARGLTIRDADRVAIALGTHPVLIWPEFYDVTNDPLAIVEEVGEP